MQHEQHHYQWPGPSDNPVIDAMLHDKNSYHWTECQTCVNRFVQKYAFGFSSDEKEEIIQDTMLWIVRYLPDFKRDCRLTSWIIQIVRSRIIDASRAKIKLKDRYIPHPNDPEEDGGNDAYISKISSPRTAEEECVLHEELQEALDEILAFLSSHANSERNIRILKMYLAGFNQKDIANRLHIPAPNVGYTLRTLQGFLRKQKKHNLPPS